MGACGSDLTERFGPEIAKLVTVEKGKQFIDQKTKLAKDKIQSQSE